MRLYISDVRYALKGETIKLKVSFKEGEINLESFLLKLTPNTEIVLVLQGRDECGVNRTTLRVEGHPTRIMEMCGEYIGDYFITSFGLEYGVFGTLDFVVKAVKEVPTNENND